MAFRLYDIDQNGSIEQQEMVEVMKVGDSITQLYNIICLPNCCAGKVTPAQL